MYILEICPDNPEIAKFYASRLNYECDSGIDLFFPQSIHIAENDVLIVDLGIRCQMRKEGVDGFFPFDLYPRSSIAKTPLMLANSVGIIDRSYRGNIKAGLRAIGNGYSINKGERLLQICAPDRDYIKVKIISEDQLTKTDRGASGFGSTGK